MLVYDRKQISRMQKIIIPALVFTAIVLMGNMDTLMADWTQSEPLERGKTLTLILQMLTTGNALLVAPVCVPFHTVQPASMKSDPACLKIFSTGQIKQAIFSQKRWPV